MPLNQQPLPIIFVLSGLPLFGVTIPAPILFGPPGITRPDQLQIVRPTRGTVVHTAENSFLEDFGMGVPQIFMSGTTGWDEPTGFAGLPALLALRAMITAYEELRKNSLDPSSVQLLYLDTLNFEACSVYPDEFTFSRSATKPLMYEYRMRFRILEDYIASLAFGNGLPSLSLFKDLGSLGNGLLSLGSKFLGGLSLL